MASPQQRAKKRRNAKNQKAGKRLEVNNLVFCDAAEGYPAWPSKIKLKHTGQEVFLVEFLGTYNWMLASSLEIFPFEENLNAFETKGLKSSHEALFKQALDEAKEILKKDKKDELYYVSEEELDISEDEKTENSDTMKPALTRDLSDDPNAKNPQEMSAEGLTTDKTKKSWNELFNRKRQQSLKLIQPTGAAKSIDKSGPKEQWSVLFEMKRSQSLAVKGSKRHCKFYLRGFCKKGNDCRYEHPSGCFITNGRVTRNIGPTSIYVIDEKYYNDAYVGTATNEIDYRDNVARKMHSVKSQNHKGSQEHFLEVTLKKRIGQILMGAKVPPYLEKELQSVKQLLR